jgi:hypothetical protein
MYLSRLSFSTVPGKGHDASGELQKLAGLIQSITGTRPRVLRTHFGSLGEADFQLEQELGSLGELEEGLHKVSANPDFRSWSEGFSRLLLRSPQREIFEILG